MNIKIELLSSADKKTHNLVFTSTSPLTEEELFQVVIKWVTDLIGGSNATEGNTEREAHQTKT